MFAGPQKQVLRAGDRVRGDAHLVPKLLGAESLLSTPVASAQTGVSKNRGTPKSSILMGFFHYKPSILGVFPLFLGNI